MRRYLVAATVLLSFVLADNALAQSSNASVGGFVQDSTRAFIPGVTVTATNTGTGVVTTALTNESIADALASGAALTALGVGSGTVATMVLWKKLPGRAQLLPGPLVAVGAGIEEVGRRRLVTEPEASVGLGRKHRDGVVLEQEVAEAVEDRLALVDLDGRDGVDAVSHDDIGAGIDRRMGDLLLVLQHLVPQAPVVRRDQDVDLRPERCELRDVFVQFDVVGHGQDDRWDAGAVRHPGLIRRMRRQGGHAW